MRLVKCNRLINVQKPYHGGYIAVLELRISLFEGAYKAAQMYGVLLSKERPMIVIITQTISVLLLACVAI